MYRSVIRRQRGRLAGAGIGQRRSDRLGGEHPGFHGVVHALEGRHIDKSGGVTNHHEAIAAEAFRQRIEAAFGNGLGAPFEQLATFENRPEEWMELHPLQRLVHIERGIVIVEPNDQPDRDLIGTHRVAP